MDTSKQHAPFTPGRFVSAVETAQDASKSRYQWSAPQQQTENIGLPTGFRLNRPYGKKAQLSETPLAPIPPRVRATMALAASRFASSRGDEAAAREHVGVRDDTTRAQIKLRAHATMKPPRLRISGCARFALQPRRSPAAMQLRRRSAICRAW